MVHSHKEGEEKRDVAESLCQGGVLKLSGTVGLLGFGPQSLH